MAAILRPVVTLATSRAQASLQREPSIACAASRLGRVGHVLPLLLHDERELAYALVAALPNLLDGANDERVGTGV